MNLYDLFLQNLKNKNPTLSTENRFGSYKDDERIGYLSNNLIGRSAAAMSCGAPGEPYCSEVSSWYRIADFDGKLKKIICERNAFMEKNGTPENVIPIKSLYNLYGDEVFKCDCNGKK